MKKQSSCTMTSSKIALEQASKVMNSKLVGDGLTDLSSEVVFTLYSVVRHGEAASADQDAAEKFVGKFKNFVESEGFTPDQVFNCNKTSLFWKKMAKKTYLTKEEKALPGHKPMKDRLTLLFCANASGDLKITPSLVYHSENPQVLKKMSLKVNSVLCGGKIARLG